MCRITFVVAVSLFVQCALFSQALEGSANSPNRPNLHYTGTFLTRDKSSTRGYPENTVVQPTFLAQSLPCSGLKFLVFTQRGGIHNDHSGSIESTVKLRAGRAIFKQGTYVLRIQFRPGLVDLSDSGDPMDGGMGAGVSVTGRYYLKSSHPPNFRKAEKDFGLLE